MSEIEIYRQLTFAKAETLLESGRGLNLGGMGTQARATEHGKRRLTVSKSGAAVFVLVYVVCFLVFRFGDSKNPMPTALSASVAIPIALVIVLLIKVQFSRRI